MKDQFEILKKPWLLWEHDPCVEGGWDVSGFDTREEAIAAAKVRFDMAEANFQTMVEHCKKDGRLEPWVRENECYDGCVVTPGLVFRMDVEIPEAKK